jgi:hypothetical protein
VLGEWRHKKKPLAVDARGCRLLPQPEALFDPDDVFLGYWGTPLGSGPLEEVTFEPTLRFIAGERGTFASPIQHHYGNSTPARFHTVGEI